MCEPMCEQKMSEFSNLIVSLGRNFIQRAYTQFTRRVRRHCGDPTTSVHSLSAAHYSANKHRTNVIENTIFRTGGVR